MKIEEEIELLSRDEFGDRLLIIKKPKVVIFECSFQSISNTWKIKKKDLIEFLNEKEKSSKWKPNLIKLTERF